MKINRNSLFVFLFVLLFLNINSLTAGEKWWEQERILAEDSELVDHAEDIYGAIVNVADKNSSRLPKGLIVIDNSLKIPAHTLANGKIVITSQLLKKLYEDVPETIGDSRLAFILGHELTHLFYDDFWHFESYSELMKHVQSKHNAQLTNLFEQSTDVLKYTKQGLASRRIKEIKADSKGIIYMTMAGFDPNAIVGKEANDFFKFWVKATRVDPKHEQNRKGLLLAEKKISAFYTNLVKWLGVDRYKPLVEVDTHMSPLARKAMLLVILKNVSDSIELFNFGVKAYQIGDYHMASMLFEHFSKQFPSREVFNNIGLSNYQKAINILKDCNRHLAYRYKLALNLEVETRAAIIQKGVPASKCFDNDDFSKQIDNAIDNFKRATRRDPEYVRGYVNLSAAYLLKGNYYLAAAQTAKMLKLQAPIDKKEVWNNHAIALLHLNDKKEAINILKRLCLEYPEFSDPPYNLAAIYFDVEGEESKNYLKYRDQFLSREPSSYYAMYSGKGISPSLRKVDTSTLFEMLPKPGLYFKKKELKHWARMIAFADNSIQIRQLNDVKALIVNDEFYIVEKKQLTGISLKKLLKALGNAKRSIEHKQGTTLIYEKINNRGIALHIRNGEIQSIVLFK